MATLQKKHCRGHVYWQIVQSRRVNGKPRPVVLMHLGTIKSLIIRLQENPEKPVRARSVEFGAIAALWRIAMDLDIVGIIDQHVPKRLQGMTCGQYLLLAAINRCVGATSKAALHDWYADTALARLMPVPKRALASQRFWDHMHTVGAEAISAIEHDLTVRLMERFDVKLDTLLFDATNFDTFIDTQTDCLLAQRGHAKSKRADLRIVGLALLVSTECHIPLFSQVYPGNRNDAALFRDVLEPVVARLQALAQEPTRLTLVFDGGNVSAANLEKLRKTGHGFITSLGITQDRDLLAVPLRDFQRHKHPRLQGTCTYRTRKMACGQDLTLVVTRSDSMLQGQLRGIVATLRKRRAALRELRGKLRRSQQGRRRGRGYTQDSLATRLKEITSGQYISLVLKTAISTTATGQLDFQFWTDPAATRTLIETRLGKRILCTNNHDWSTEQVVLGSRAQYHVEDAFRQLKHPRWVRFRPTYHWTDHSLRVHALYCTVALTLTTLLQRRATEAGLPLSAERLYAELTGIREHTNLYRPRGGKGSLRAEFVPSELSDTQARLFSALGLADLMPTADR